MLIIGNFLFAIAMVFQVIFTFLTWLIVIQALLSWVNPDPYNPIVRILHASTAPIYRFTRKILPGTVYGQIDFSPMIVLVALIFLSYFLPQLLIEYAGWFKAGSLPPNL